MPAGLPVNRVEGQVYVGANIQTDGFLIYQRCKFQNCTMLYNGGQYMVQPDCTLENCNWALGGGAANTLALLRSWFSHGGKEREMVEAMITQIRTMPPLPVKRADTSGSVQ